MVSLLDIGELREEVEIRGQKVTTTGLPGEGVMRLLEEFPELRKLIVDRTDFDGKLIMQQAPETICSIIASGLGHPGDPEYKKKAATLSLGEQTDLVMSILRLTFPRGVASFIDALVQLAEDVERAAVGSGWDPATKSPERSNGASTMAIPQQSPGDTHHASSPLGSN